MSFELRIDGCTPHVKTESKNLLFDESTDEPSSILQLHPRRGKAMVRTHSRASSLDRREIFSKFISKSNEYDPAAELYQVNEFIILETDTNINTFPHKYKSCFYCLQKGTMHEREHKESSTFLR